MSATPPTLWASTEPSTAMGKSASAWSIWYFSLIFYGSQRLFAQQSLWVLLYRLLKVSFLSACNLTLIDTNHCCLDVVNFTHYTFMLSIFFCPAGCRTAAPWTSRWRRQGRSQSRSSAKSASLWVAPTPLLLVSCSGGHTTRNFFFFALPTNHNSYKADMQYLSFQVIKGLSYLREKHKIMHRGQSLFYLPNT